MIRSLRITTAAHRDLVRLGRYLVDQNAVVARRFLRSVALSGERIRKTPDLGELWNDDDPSIPPYRCWCVRGFESFVIYYRVLPDTVEIVRVLHSAQDAGEEVKRIAR